jgi:hypothetical protein
MASESRRGLRAGRRTRVIDFRGRTLLLVRKEDLEESVPRKVRVEVGAANQHRWTPVLGTALLIIPSALVGLLIVRGISWFTGLGSAKLPNVTWLAIAAFAAYVVFCGVFLGSLLARRRGIAAVRACLNAGLCPSCGYSLAGSAVEADGCVACGECGGAWKLE